jgi:hypothetical protein
MSNALVEEVRLPVTVCCRVGHRILCWKCGLGLERPEVEAFLTDIALFARCPRCGAWVCVTSLLGPLQPSDGQVEV